MTTLNALYPTLLDFAKRSDPNGKIEAVAEILTETNEILADMVWVEGNLPTGHRTTVRTGLPTPTWRKMYGGVQPSKSSTAQITDNTGMLEAYAEVDKALADLNGNTAAWRLSEEYAFIEAMSQEIADTIFYGNEGTEPEAFTGLSPRYNARTGYENSENIIHGGGSGSDNFSIWLVVWGPDTVHGIVPKGSKAGLQVEDKGQVTLESAPGTGSGRMEAYRTHYRWDAGLTLRDWRYVVRIANIDKSDLSVTWTNGAFSAGANLPDLMFQAMSQVPNLSKGKPVFYMPRIGITAVRRQLSAMGNQSYLTQQMAGGSWVESFQTIPMRRVDALAANETLVS